MTTSTPAINTAYPPAAPRFSDAQLLQIYLALAVVANFACVFFNGYSGDLGYWFGWISQLSAQGYKSLDANYPPVFIHWIYIVSKLIPALGAPLENNLLLKALIELPTLACHLLLLLLINYILDCTGVKRLLRHWLLALTALNPAILFNGPVWGQVDLIPVSFALAAILLHFSARWRLLAMPFYMLAILTKFQMICFAPVMGILFFRQLKTHLMGIALSGLVFAAAFAPFIFHHEFVRYFQQAYIKTLGEYAYTTLNAANLWMLLTGNTIPDTRVMFTLNEGQPFALAVQAKYLGMGLFALVSLLVFARGLVQQYRQQLGDEHTQVSRILFYALLCALAFFTLLPAMHERYLFPAVVMAIAYAASQPKGLFYALLITMICFINMALINGINGSDVWLGLAWLAVASLALALLEFFIGASLQIFFSDLLDKLTRLKWLGLWSWLLCTYLVIGGMVHQYRVQELPLASNQQLLTQLPIAHAVQSHGTLHINRSVDGHYLSIGNQRYANGLGTHSQSDITYFLPAGAQRLSFKVGVDDEVGMADMQFSVWGDGQQLWRSAIYYGFESDGDSVELDISRVHELTLRVEPVTNMQFDHADWINPVISFDRPQAKPQ